VQRLLVLLLVANSSALVGSFWSHTYIIFQLALLGCLLFLQRLLGLLLAGKESALVVANSLALFARLLLQHPAAFEHLLGSAAAAGISAGSQQQQQQQDGGGSSPEALLLGLVSVWCDAFDSIAQPLARKLAACGLAALLGLPVKVNTDCMLV
jgi:hypothetical protein